MAQKPAIKAPPALTKLKINTTDSDLCSKAWLILKHTHESSQALLTAYRLARGIRGVKEDKEGKMQLLTLRGMSTDEEQDLLRSMVVTAASGLDSMTKQLIRDALPKLIEVDQSTLSGLEKFVQRRLKGESEEQTLTEASLFLARILVAPSVQKRIIDEYISWLTRGSLQSVDELSRVASALALAPRDVGVDHNTLKPIFDIRNKIIHELDINLDAPRRKRNVRGEPKMRAYTNTLLDVAARILRAVDVKLAKTI